MSEEHPTPHEVRELGDNVLHMYWRLKDELIQEHNKTVRREVEEETTLIKRLTAGQSTVDCPNCGETVA